MKEYDENDRRSSSSDNNNIDNTDINIENSNNNIENTNINIENSTNNIDNTNINIGNSNDNTNSDIKTNNSGAAKPKIVVKMPKVVTPELYKAYMNGGLLGKGNIFIPGLSNNPFIKINLSPEEKLDRYNKKFVEDLDKNQNSYNNSSDIFIGIYGPKGKVPDRCSNKENEKSEYNNITIDVPEELDDEIVTALVLGACLDSKKMHEKLTSSSSNDASDTDNYKLNSDYLIENIAMGDNRSEKFVPVMIDGKKKAIEAIEAYKNGDKTKVNHLLNAVGDFANMHSNNLSALENETPVELTYNHKLYFFWDNLQKNPKINGFRRNIKSFEKVLVTNTDSYTNQIKYVRDSNKTKKSLIDNNKFFELGKEEKEDAVLNILLYDYAAATSVNRNQNIIEQSNKFIYDSFKNLGINENTPPVLEDRYPNLVNELENTPEIQIACANYRASISTYTTNDLSCIIAKPDGIDTLKQLYGKEIKNSQVFKDIMASKNRSELIKNIRNIKASRSEGLLQFKNVALPNEAEKINSRSKIAIENTLGKSRNLINDTIIKKYFKNDLDACSIKSFDKAGLKQNAAFIKKMVSDIASVNRYTSGPNFKEMKNSLNSLYKYANQLADMKGNISISAINEYNNKINEVSNLALKYLENKTDINSNYARSRVDAVGKLRRNLMMHTMTLDDARNAQLDKYKETAKKYENKNIQKFSHATKDNKKVFWGDYKFEDLTGTPFTAERSAGISVATFALMNAGYSFDEVTDPSLIQDEKRKMFDTVIQKMKRFNADDKKWLAKTIYDGFKKYDEMMNEQSKNIDFKDPKFARGELFSKMGNLAHIGFDNWQEMEQLKDEVTELAKKELPNVANYEDYKMHRRQRYGIMKSLMNHYSEMLKNVSQAANEATADTNVYKDLLANSLAFQLDLQLMDKLTKQNPDKPFSELLVDSQVEYLFPLEHYVQENINKFTKAFRNDPESTKAVMNSILDSSIFKDVKVQQGAKPGEFEITNLPDAAKLKQEAEIQKFLDKANIANNRLTDNKTVYHSYDQYFNDLSYLMTAKVYYINEGLLVNPNNHKPMSLESVRKQLIKTRAFKNAFKASSNPDKYYKPKNAYAKVKSLRVIKSIFGTMIPDDKWAKASARVEANKAKAVANKARAAKVQGQKPGSNRVQKPVQGNGMGGR
ncbi:MAG: hypothetical protein K6G11_05415 [Lachnospiraceae bacterium]|nr:hypothetical protein [Lachnospiraceae bacterium]